jgi:hypothetical protein
LGEFFFFLTLTEANPRDHITRLLQPGHGNQLLPQYNHHPQQQSFDIQPPAIFWPDVIGTAANVAVGQRNNTVPQSGIPAFSSHDVLAVDTYLGDVLLDYEDIILDSVLMQDDYSAALINMCQEFGPLEPPSDSIERNQPVAAAAAAAAPSTPVTIATAPALTPVLTCPRCGKHKFGRRAELTRHMKDHDPSRKVFNCTVTGCPRKNGNGFARRDKLQDHMRQKHKINRPY